MSNDAPPLSARNRRKRDDSSPSLAPMTKAPPPSRKSVSNVPASAAKDAKGAVDPKSREKKPPSRVLGWARAVLGGALIVSLSTGMALGARKYVKTSPRFKVADVVVTGMHRRTADEIAQVGQLQKGTNIFSVDLAKTRALVLGDPWVKEASVSRRLPGTVTIVVVEKEPAVLIAAGDTYLYTREGLPIKRLETQDPSDFPIITGLAPEMLTDDREGAAHVVKASLELVDTYERMGLGQRAPIEELHYEKDGALSLIVGKSGTVLALGQAPFKRKLAQAVRVLAELDRRGQKPDTVFLDNEAHPERVVVRMR